MDNQSNLMFSIVIPVYNKEKYLQRCITSVLSQTHENFEAIFVDDGSTDNGVEVIKSFTDARIRLIRQANRGVSAARNLGIESSVNPVIAFLDADDEWYPNHLATLSFLIGQFRDGGIYSTGFRLNYEDSSPAVDMFVNVGKYGYSVLGNPFRPWSAVGVTNCSNTAVWKNVLDEVGLFKERVTINEDLDLWMRIAARFPAVFSSTVTSIYHQVRAEEKPRYRKWPQNIFLCETAARLIKENPSINPHSVKEYIRSLFGIYFWYFALSNDREPLRKILVNSNAKTWAPVYYWLEHVSVFWPILRIVAKIRSLFRSRFALLLMGGRKKRKGVVISLVRNDKSSWSSYIFRKRKNGSIYKG